MDTFTFLLDNSCKKVIHLLWHFDCLVLQLIELTNIIMLRWIENKSLYSWGPIVEVYPSPYSEYPKGMWARQKLARPCSWAGQLLLILEQGPSTLLTLNATHSLAKNTWIGKSQPQHTVSQPPPQSMELTLCQWVHCSDVCFRTMSEVSTNSNNLIHWKVLSLTFFQIMYHRI